MSSFVGKVSERLSESRVLKIINDSNLKDQIQEVSCKGKLTVRYSTKIMTDKPDALKAATKPMGPMGTGKQHSIVSKQIDYLQVKWTQRQRIHPESYRMFFRWSKNQNPFKGLSELWFSDIDWLAPMTNFFTIPIYEIRKEHLFELWVVRSSKNFRLGATFHTL